jgi:hypothetical protein
LIAGRFPFLCWPAGFGSGLAGMGGSSGRLITRGMLQHVGSAGGAGLRTGRMLFTGTMSDVCLRTAGVRRPGCNRGVRQIHRTGAIAAAGGELARSLPFLL